MLTFKYNTLKSRLVSYKQYWNRTNRLIEEGKYSRDRFKMEIHEKVRLPAQVGVKSEINAETEHIYQQFLQARKACNLSIDNVTREMVTEIVEKHKLAAMKKYKCNDVEFCVTVENGNPKLKIRPRS
jgi:hypothetical protein